jgi:3'-phosphoadenosine 5'-phosphosulfate (PAPS) 3'-phosphatase
MPDDEGRRVAAALGAAAPHRVHSVGVKIALLATGAYDVYVNTHPISVWDLAAPAAILAEAGGTYSDLDGRPLPLRADGTKVAGGTLATIGRDHAAVLAAVRAAL